jgi:hypothetical protein
VTEPVVAALAPEDVIAAESPIGVFPLSQVGSTSSVSVPKKRNLVDGIGLMAPPPAGVEVDGDHDRLVSRVTDELGRLLGGWFEGDLTPYVRLYDSLASPEQKAYFDAPGIAMHWDEPASGAFSWLAFRLPPWQVQAVGDAGDFHCVSLGHPLAEKDALGEGGHPRKLPVGPPVDVLREATPVAAAAQFRDESQDHPGNVYDTFLSAEGLKVKGGVRMRVDGSGHLLGYFYGVRVVVRP